MRGRPICGCGNDVFTEMSCKENGVLVVDSNKEETPYSVRDADRYECVNCGRSVLMGFGEAYYLTEKQMVNSKENLTVIFV